METFPWVSITSVLVVWSLGTELSISCIIYLLLCRQGRSQESCFPLKTREKKGGSQQTSEVCALTYGLDSFSRVQKTRSQIIKGGSPHWAALQVLCKVRILGGHFLLYFLSPWLSCKYPFIASSYFSDRWSTDTYIPPDTQLDFHLGKQTKLLFSPMFMLNCQPSFYNFPYHSFII